MKTNTIKIFLYLLAIGIMPTSAADGGKIKEQIVVNLDRAGTLPEKIGESKKYDIMNLKLTGKINGRDLQMVREMAGGGNDERETNGSLEELDMSDATIVEGETYTFYDAEKNKATTGYSWNNIIASHLFSGCKRLRSVSLPQTATVIKDHAFSGCCNLEKIAIGNATKEIGNNAFSNCCSLMSLVLPQSVSTIGDKAFEGCKSLTLIEAHSMEVPLLGKEVFSGIEKSHCRLLIPKGTYNAYWLSAWGDNISNIIETFNIIEKTINKRKH